jgi:alanine racemase
MRTDLHSSWLEIDLGAIRNNVREMQRITQRPVMAVVKANAYGHGIEAVGQAVVQAGAAWCGVARIEEAMILRETGVVCPILVMGYTPPERVKEALQADVSLTVDLPEVAAAYAQSAGAANEVLKCHVKVDTGMSRLGIAVENGGSLIHWVHEHEHLLLEGVFTHFARADEPQSLTTNQQLVKFQRLVDEIEADGMRPPWVHAANSAAGLYFPETRFDMVRPGIAIYGLHPSLLAPLPETFHPALSMKTRITHVRSLPPGQGISYGHRYVTNAQERVGTLAIGYADGFRRWPGNKALVRGSEVSVVGTVCMDQCVVSLEDVPEARVGDEVVLLGRQGQAHISAERLAEAWGTINYEVVCGMAFRLPRLYYDGQGSPV